MEISKEKRVELTTDELQDELELQRLEHEYFKVTETYPEKYERSYIVRGLYMEIEDGICYCSDDDNLIPNNEYRLKAIGEKFINNIFKIFKNDVIINEVCLTNGNILIEAL